MFTSKPKTEIEIAQDKLRELSERIQRNRPIVYARGEELAAEMGRNVDHIDRVLIHEARGKGKAAEATQALMSAKGDLPDVITPIQAEASRLSQDAQGMLEASFSAVTAQAREKLLPIMGDNTERVIRLVPAVIAEIEFQNRHPVREWARTISFFAQNDRLFDSENPAAQILTTFAMQQKEFELIKAHSAAK